MISWALVASLIAAGTGGLKKQTKDWFQVVFETLDYLSAFEEKPKRTIGFTAKRNARRMR